MHFAYSRSNQGFGAVRTGQGAALLVFRGWAESHALVRVEMKTALCAIGLSARVVDVSDTELRLLSDDTESDFVLRFPAVCSFTFEDIRTLPTTDQAPFGDMVIVWLAPQSSQDADRIAFAVDIRHEN